VKKNFLEKNGKKPTEGREKGPKKSDSGIRETKISAKSLFLLPNIYISKEFIPTDGKIPLLLGEIPIFLCLLSESPL